MRKHDVRNLGGIFLLSIFAAACGGDAELGGPGGPDGDGPNDGPIVESVKLLSSDAQLQSGAIADEDGIQITAIARDANNNLVPGADLTFSTDNGGINPAGTQTAENGRLTAILTTAGDARNRTINVSAGRDGATLDTLAIDVVGTSLQVTGPQAIRPQASGVFELQLTDSRDNGIRDVAINVTSANGNSVDPATITTGPDGSAQVSVTASTPGQDKLTFEGFDLSATASFVTSRFQLGIDGPVENLQAPFGTNVAITAVLSEGGSPSAGEEITFSTTRGSFAQPCDDTAAPPVASVSRSTDAQGRASATLCSQQRFGAGPALLTITAPEGVERTRTIQLTSTQPQSITIQADPATVAVNEESSIIARVTDDQGNPVTNRPVTFRLQDASAGSLSSGRAITDLQGVARTTYQPAGGSRSEGASVFASVDGQAETIEDRADITVREAPFFIVLGSDNQITKNSEDAIYEKVYNATITDAGGNPPPADADTEFRVTVRSVEYQKGFLRYDGTQWTKTAGFQYPVGPFDLDDEEEPFDGTDFNGNGMFGPYFGTGPFGCRSEDPLGTGNSDIDDGIDDYNNNGVIDPPNVATIPTTSEIDENGIASFRLRWPQNFSQWVLVRMTAFAAVDGTESRRRIDFALPVAAEDVTEEDVTPPNVTSPFGTTPPCSNPN